MADPTRPLSFSLNPSSAADAGGDTLFEAPFNVTFGNKATAANASASGLPQSAIGGVLRDVAIGVAVALAARWLWKEIS